MSMLSAVGEAAKFMQLRSVVAYAFVISANVAMCEFLPIVIITTAKGGAQSLESLFSLKLKRRYTCYTFAKRTSIDGDHSACAK